MMMIAEAFLCVGLICLLSGVYAGYGLAPALIVAGLHLTMVAVLIAWGRP